PVPETLPRTCPYLRPLRVIDRHLFAEEHLRAVEGGEADRVVRCPERDACAGAAMTGYTGRKNHGRGHTYYIDGGKVDGVTTILSTGPPKPALVRWAANTAAELAVNEWDELACLPVADRLKRIADGPNVARDTAAVRGTRIHALADRL